MTQLLMTDFLVPTKQDKSATRHAKPVLGKRQSDVNGSLSVKKKKTSIKSDLDHGSVQSIPDNYIVIDDDSDDPDQIANETGRRGVQSMSDQIIVIDDDSGDDLPLARSLNENGNSTKKNNHDDPAFDDSVLPVSFERLSRLDVTGAEVAEDVFALIPGLLDFKDDIDQLVAKHSERQYPPVVFPEYPANDWPKLNPVLDYHWNKIVENEPRPSNVPKKLNMDNKYLVKPFGDPDSPLAAVFSYPPMQSTVRPEYATVHDMSNQCMAEFFAKVGFHRTGLREKPILALDTFPRRLNRDDFKSGRAKSFQVIRKKLPKSLVQFHEEQAMSLVESSTAFVLLLFGENARDAYQNFVRTQKSVKAKEISIPNLREGAVVFLEYRFEHLHRIVFHVTHPEKFIVDRGQGRTMVHWQGCVYERLIDLATIYAYGDEPFQPSFLSTLNYFKQYKIGIFEPITAFEPGQYQFLLRVFTRPRFQMKALTAWLKYHPHLSEDRIRKAIGSGNGRKYRPRASGYYWVNLKNEIGPVWETYELICQAFLEAQHRYEEKGKKGSKN